MLVAGGDFYDESYYMHPMRRLSDTEPFITHRKALSYRQVRNAAKNLPEAKPKRTVQPNAAARYAL